MRETLEETGLTLKNFDYRGIITVVSDEWGTEYMHLFTADEFEGELKSCDEGVLEWIDKKELLSKNIWQGDKIFLGLIETKCPFFSLKLEYCGQTLKAAVLNGTEKLV